MRTLLLSLVLLFCLAVFVNCGPFGLRCIKCDKSKCRSDEDLKCVGGYVPGICGCCKRCGKQEGDKCEGILSIYGICDKGLVCAEVTGDVKEEPGICMKKGSKSKAKDRS